MSFDYKKKTNPFVKVAGKYYSLDDVLIALGKALVKKGILTKSEILAEL